MTALRAVRKRSISTCLALAALLLTVHTASSQIRIGGVTIPKPNRTTPAKAEKPQSQPQSQSQPENTTRTSEVRSEPAAKSKTSLAASQAEPPGLLSYFLSEIAEAKKDVDIYDPAERQYLVKAVQEEWVLRAVSPRARTEHAAAVKYTEWRQANPGNQLDAALDDLAASVAKKFPIYKPGVGAFQFRNPVAEKLLLGEFKSTATMKIHRIGVSAAGWQIQTGSDGLPSYRFKFANVYFRDSTDDHPYCHLVTVRVKQDYAGGGRYSTEVYRSSAEDELYGCP
jgi:hypothetical protein